MESKNVKVSILLRSWGLMKFLISFYFPSRSWFCHIQWSDNWDNMSVLIILVLAWVPNHFLTQVDGDDKNLNTVESKSKLHINFATTEQFIKIGFAT